MSAASWGSSAQDLLLAGVGGGAQRAGRLASVCRSPRDHRRLASRSTAQRRPRLTACCRARVYRPAVAMTIARRRSRPGAAAIAAGRQRRRRTPPATSTSFHPPARPITGRECGRPRRRPTSSCPRAAWRPRRRSTLVHEPGGRGRRRPSSCRCARVEHTMYGRNGRPGARGGSVRARPAEASSIRRAARLDVPRGPSPCSAMRPRRRVTHDRRPLLARPGPRADRRRSSRVDPLVGR